MSAVVQETGPAVVAESAGKPNKAPARRRSYASSQDLSKEEFVPKSKSAYIEMRLNLVTESSQKVYEATKEPAQISFYIFDVLLVIRFNDSPTSQKQYNLVSAEIEKRFTEIEGELDKELARLKVLADNLGVDRAECYTNENPNTVRIYSASFGRYLDLLSKMDLICRDMDGLWLSRAVSNVERNNCMIRWRNRLIRFNREVYNLRTLVSSYADKVARLGAGSNSDDIVMDFKENTVKLKGEKKAAKRKAERKNGKVVKIDGGALNNDAVAAPADAKPTKAGKASPAPSASVDASESPSPAV